MASGNKKPSQRADRALFVPAAIVLASRKAMPFFLSIPQYGYELMQIRTPPAFYRWIYFKFPFAFPFASFPLYVTIELTTLCNLGCRHCWRLRSVEKRGIGSMAVGTFEKIIREISTANKPPDVLKIGGAGEPALHPEFPHLMDYLDMLKGKGVHTIVYTNGTLFEKFSAQQITRWRIDRIVVSVDGIDPDSYERIRVGGNYRKLRELVCNFRAFCDQTPRHKPWIEIRHVIMEDETLKQLLRFRKKWVALGNTVKFQNLNEIRPETTQASTRTDRGTSRELAIEWNGGIGAPENGEQTARSIESQTIEELWRERRAFCRDH